MATWKMKILRILTETGDTLKELSFIWGDTQPRGANDERPFTTHEDALNEEFDAGFGGQEGRSFIAYSKNYVYFVIEYDGCEGVAYVPRNPMQGYRPRHL